MSFHDRLNNMLQRFKLSGVDDTGGLQKVKGIGRGSVALGGQVMIIRLQPAGLSAVPSAGEGMALSLSGNPDQAMVMGVENPDKRPKGQEPGETTLYGEFNNTLKLDKNGDAILTVRVLRVIATESVIIEAPEVHLGGEGGQPVAILGSTDSGGDHITGGCAAKVFAL